VDREQQEPIGRDIDLVRRRERDFAKRVTGKGQITIPPAMRKKHGLVPRAEVELVDRPEGVLVIKAAKLSGGKRVLSALLRGGKIRGRTSEWLRLTRSDE